jgi:hypothetical protein
MAKCEIRSARAENDDGGKQEEDRRTLVKRAARDMLGFQAVRRGSQCVTAAMGD